MIGGPFLVGDGGKERGGYAAGCFGTLFFVQVKDSGVVRYFVDIFEILF